MEHMMTITGPSELPDAVVLIAAHRAGITLISGPKLGRLAGVSTRTAWTWLRGRSVSVRSDLAIRAALGLPLPAILAPRRGRPRKHPTTLGRVA